VVADEKPYQVERGSQTVGHVSEIQAPKVLQRPRIASVEMGREQVELAR
jgi:hypothetical protein